MNWELLLLVSGVYFFFGILHIIGQIVSDMKGPVLAVPTAAIGAG